MSGRIVLGIRERKRLASGLAAHLDGTTRPATAIDAERCRSQRGREPIEALLPDASAEVRALLQKHRENRRRGGQPNELIELLLAGPPPWEHERDEDGNLAGEPPWPPEKVDEWRDASLAWGEKIFGPESRLLGAWLHADEMSPHIHLAGVPIHEGRISWKALKLRFARDFLGREKVHHRSIYSAMRNSYHTEVGQRFGLARGEVKVFDERGQDAKPIDRAKTAEHRERVAKAEAKAAEERVRKLEIRHNELQDDIEAGTRGVLGRRAKRGQQIKAETDKARRERDEIETRANAAIEAAHRDRDAAIQDAEANRAAAEETRAWRTSMRMPRQDAVPTFTPKEVRDEVRRRLELAKAEGVRTLWKKLRDMAGEHGAEYLASLARLVGPVFGVRNLAALAKPSLRSDRRRGAGIG